MNEKQTLFDENIEEIERISFIPWEKLAERVILITGATGLIGTTLIRVLDDINQRKNLHLTVLALVRNEERAKERFSEILGNGMLKLVVGSVESLPSMNQKIDYIIHGASQTASKEFVNHAVETIYTALTGTRNLLELAKEKQVVSMVYLSSMEVYGYPTKGHKVTESEIGAFSPLELRNSYPMSKVMSEMMCRAYAEEYQVPVKMIRLTQTFGPGVSWNDSRVFAYFARCVKEKTNIVLKTKGETERSYLRSIDAVTAILSILLNGESGQAYNAADENTYCSIAEMAERVAEDGGIKVEYDIQDSATTGYLNTLYMDLDTTALKELGWMPFGGGMSISEMYQEMIAGMINVKLERCL